MRTSLLLLTVLLIATPVRGEKPVSDVIATSASQGSLEPLFAAALQYQSDSPRERSCRPRDAMEPLSELATAQEAASNSA